MTKYLCDLPDYTFEYNRILERIAQAQTEDDLKVCQGETERFLQKYGLTYRGFWWFTWSFQSKPVHGCYEILMKQIDFQRDHMYRMAMFENICE